MKTTVRGLTRGIFFAPLIFAADKYHDPTNMGSLPDPKVKAASTAPSPQIVVSLCGEEVPNSKDEEPTQSPKTVTQRLDKFISLAAPTVIEATKEEAQRHQAATTPESLSGFVLNRMYTLAKLIYVSRKESEGRKKWCIPAPEKKSEVIKLAQELIKEMKILEATFDTVTGKSDPASNVLVGVLKERIIEFGGYVDAILNASPDSPR